MLIKNKIRTKIKNQTRAGQRQRRRTLVERRRVRPVNPRVREDDRLGVVLHDAGEVAALEEGLVEIKLQHVMQARVDVYPPFAEK